MSLDVWFSRDLANVIAGLALQADEIGDVERRAGYLAALRAVSLSVGIVELPTPLGSRRLERRADGSASVAGWGAEALQLPAR